MPRKAHSISPSQALEALHVFSTLASSTNKSYPYPAFSYTDGTAAQPNQFPMDGINAAPALVVWLFLVTNQDFLDQLDGLVAEEGSQMPSAAAIANATNLTESAVQRLLNCYINSSTNPGDDNNLRASFVRVTEAFQDFAGASGYTGGNCPPSGGKAIIDIAAQGALVEPNPAA